MEEIIKIFRKDRKAWRSWLQKNHKSIKEVWLIYYKKHTNKASISYSDAVEEAICFGWIDGQIKRIDDERYMQRYTPRTRKSLWSVINIERAQKMILQGRMTEFGLNIFRKGAKKKERVPSSKDFSVPRDLNVSLTKNRNAWNYFQKFSPSAKLAYVYWVNTAKTEETRQKRISKTVELIAQNIKYGERA